jgi:hypothetical protein
MKWPKKWYMQISNFSERCYPKESGFYTLRQFDNGKTVKSLLQDRMVGSISRKLEQEGFKTLIAYISRTDSAINRQ